MEKHLTHRHMTDSTQVAVLNAALRNLDPFQRRDCDMGDCTRNFRAMFIGTLLRIQGY